MRSKDDDQVSWRTFAARASEVARKYGAVVSDYGELIEFVNPVTSDTVMIVPLDGARTVMIRAGWFLRLFIEIQPSHMADFAVDALSGVFAGGAVEYIDVRRGTASEAGHLVRGPDGGESRRDAPRGRRQSIRHALPAWGLQS